MKPGRVVFALLIAAGTASASTPLGPDGTSGITAVAVHPQIRTRVYAAAGQPGVSRGEGIYRSDDGGVTWSEKDLGLPPGVRNKDIRAIAADGGRNVYAAIFDQGIYRSTDDGEHWSLLNATGGGWALAIDRQTNDLYASIDAAVARFDGTSWHTGQPLPEYPAALAVDPTNGRTLYAMGDYVYGTGSANALYRSTDGAATWEKIYAARSVTSLAVAASGVIYIGTNDVHTTVPLLAKSSDHGTTWSDADGDLRSVAILGTTVDALAVDGATVVAAMHSRIYRSLDAGAHWTKVDDLQEGGQISPMVSTNAGSFLAGVTTSSNLPGGILRSSDSGTTWAPSSKGIHQTQVRLILATGSTLFAAVASSAIDLGLQRTTDGGRTWERLSQQAPFQNVTLSGTTLLGGWSTTVQRSSDSGATWSTATGIDCSNDIFALTVDATQSSSVWAGALLTSEAHISCLGVFHSSDGGATFTRVTNGLGLVANPFYSSALGPMAAAGGVGYLWTAAGVYANSDNATWTLRGVPAGIRGTAFAATNSGDLWLLTDAGLQHSTDGARTWQPASPLTTSVTGALAVNGSLVAVTDGNRLFLSNDGADWGAVGSDLTNIDSLTFDPLGRLLAGTDQGVFLVDVPSHRRVSRP
jgi:hypothetical protein